VIPQPYITEWSAQAPWPAESQIEQDLILSRLIVEIASDELLADELGLPRRHLPAQAAPPRALYARRKGRDLYDLWLALTELTLDEQLIVDGLAHYMGAKLYSYRQLYANLLDKLATPEFLDDIRNLTLHLHEYEHRPAAELLMQRLGTRLRNAPTETATLHFPEQA
jgi:hypothetical protein